MNRTSTSTDTETRASRQQPRAGCNRSTSCRCGQQLDICARDHCPRCGRTLGRR